MATFGEFIRSGTLGPLSFGLTADDVRGILGLPEDESVHRNPLILKYGGAQLTFVATKRDPERRLAQIALYFWPREEAVPEPLRPADWLPSAATTEADVRSALARAGVAVHSHVDNEPNRHLVLETGGSVTFVDGRLAAIHVKARAPKPTSLSVPVGEPALAALTTRARQTNRAATDVAADWIARIADTVE